MDEYKTKRLAGRMPKRMLGSNSPGKAAVGQAALQELASALRMLRVASAIDALASGDTEKARSVAEAIASSSIAAVGESMPHAREALGVITEYAGEDDAGMVEQVSQLVELGELVLDASE